MSERSMPAVRGSEQPDSGRETVDPEAALELLKAFGKAFNRGDIDAILELVTDDFEWHLAQGPVPPHGRIVRGREAVRATLEERARTWPEMRFSETEVTVGADRVVGTFRATGRRADGTPVDVRGVDVYRIRNGRIALKDSYWKQIEPDPG